MLRRAAKSIQNADDCCVSGKHADPNRRDHGNAENQGHEERNHGQPPYLDCGKLQYFRCRQLTFRICGFFNLLALTLTAIDD
jgi:hypothetical protein